MAFNIRTEGAVSPFLCWPGTRTASSTLGFQIGNRANESFLPLLTRRTRLCIATTQNLFSYLDTALVMEIPNGGATLRAPSIRSHLPHKRVTSCLRVKITCVGEIRREIRGIENEFAEVVVTLNGNAADSERLLTRLDLHHSRKVKT